MTKRIVVLAFVAALLTTAQCQAQSLSDLLNLDKISKVVNSVTGLNTSDNITGTWNYTNPAVEFKSDDLLKKAGGAVAASAVESKMSTQLSKVGIKAGQMSFTFNDDDTFTSTVGKRTMSGTYTYDKTTRKVQLTYMYLLNVSASVNCTNSSLELLFESDKLLKILAFLTSKSSSTTTKTIGTLASGYDGMLMGFEMKK